MKTQQALTLETLAERWGLVAIAVFGAFMVSIGWLKWPDLMIDYGSQAYIPWQIAEGKVLYRDIHYLFGPLPSHVHALLFSIFGPSIRVLIVFNLLLVAGITALVFVIFRRSADALTATLCAIGFLVVFALAQYQGRGNFNFVTPYNHELTHGIFLSFVALYLFYTYLERPHTAKLVGLGCLTGMVFLTKAEVFLAVFAAIAGGLTAAWYYQGGPLRTKLFKAGVWALAFVSVPAVFWLYLSLHMPAGRAFLGMVGPWLHIWDPFPHSLPMYQWLRGTDNLPDNLMKLFGAVLDWAGILGILCAVHYLFLNKVKHAYARLAGWSLVILVSITIYSVRIPWMELMRPLPLLMVTLGILYGVRLKNGPSTERTQSLFLVVFCVFSLVLMFKILFNTHVFHYGFALAFPAFLILVRFLVHEVPAWLPSGRQAFSFAHAMAPALILTYILAHASISYNLYMIKKYPVGVGSDMLLDYNPDLSERGPVLNAALHYIGTEIGAKEAFPVLPGGSMINYLSRHPNPFPFLTFDPLEMHFQGEGRYLEHFKARPPRHIAIVARHYQHLGAQYFGEGYAEDLYKWIRSNYKEVKLFGQSPYSGEGYGILFLEHMNGSLAANPPS